MNSHGLEPVANRSIWTGDELSTDRTWMLRLDASAVAELEHALAYTVAGGLEIEQIRRCDFPLPTLGPTLSAIEAALLHGRGFSLVRGIPLERYSRREVAALFWGIACHLGDAVLQNGSGDLLGHVVDLGEPDEPHRRRYRAGGAIPFHIDSCDITCLLCLSKARSGGESRLACAGAVHNEMVRRRPDLARALAEPVYIDRRGEVPPGGAPYYRLPVFNYHCALMSCAYGNGDIYHAQRHPEVPRLSDAQRDAFERFESTAASTGLEMTLEEGDLQFVHNHTVLHGRTGYTDDPERPRHLLRIYLSSARARALPDSYEDRFGAVDAGTVRGGIRIPGVEPRVVLESSAMSAAGPNGNGCG